MAKIDYDRGVVKKVHATTGAAVYMYVDEPGIFRSAFGTEVAEALAKEAGFDVEALAKKRVMRERMQAAKIAIETELEMDQPVNETVKEAAGFKIVHIGLGRHQVKDPDDNVLTPAPMPLEQAELLMKHLVPAKAAPKAKGPAAIDQFPSAAEA